MSRMGIGKRVMCLVLAAAMLCSCTGLTTLAADGAGAFDPGFEQLTASGSLACWETATDTAPTDTTVSVTSDAHSGSSAVQFVKTAGTAYKNAYIQTTQHLTSLEGGSEYVVSVWVKAQNMLGCGYYIDLYDPDNGWSLIGRVESFSTGTAENGWTRMYGTITPAKDIARAVVRITLHGTQSSGSATVKIDDLAVEKVAAAQELTYDPGFEQLVTSGTLACWETATDTAPTDTTVSVTSDAHSGSSAVQFVKTAGTAYKNAYIQTTQHLTGLEGGNDYEISVWVKAQNMLGCGYYIDLYDPDNGWSLIGRVESFSTGETENGWTRMYGTVSIAGDVSRAVVRITLHGTQSSSSATVKIDDLAIEKLVELQEPVFDPGFELSGEAVGASGPFGTWELGTANAVSIIRDTSDAHSGAASVRFTKPAGSDYRCIDSLGSVALTVEPGAQYALRVWEKIENANGAIALVAVYAKGYTALVAETATDAMSVCQTENGWTQKETVITVPEGVTQVILRIMVLGTQSSGTAVFHYDDISLTKQEHLVTPVYDPGFEISGPAAGISGSVFAAWEQGTDTAPTDAYISQDTDIFHTGAASLKVTKPADSTGNIFVQNTHYKIPVNGGDTYVISLWMRSENANGAAGSLLLISQDWQWVKPIAASELTVTETDGQWSKLEVTVKLPETMTEAIVRIVVDGTQTGQEAHLWFDDLQMLQAADMDTAFDPGFEKLDANGRLTAWVDGGGTLSYSLDSSDVHGGSYALKIERPNGVEGSKILETTESIPVKANTTYYIRYYGKALNLSTTDNMFILVTGDGMEPTAVADTGNRSSDQWFKQSGYITTGETTTQLKLQVCTSGVNSSGQDGAVWFDDIVIEEAPAGTGSFDGSFDVILDGEALNWRHYIVPSLEASEDDFSYEVTDDGYDGTAITYYKKGSGYIGSLPNAALPVQGGCSYELRYWVRTENADECAAYVMVEQFVDGGCTTHTAVSGYTVGYYVYGNTEWKQVITTFTTQADAVAVKLMPTLSDAEVSVGYTGGGTASATFDELSLTQVETLGPTDNFGFEYGYEVPRDWTFSAGVDFPEELPELDKTNFGVSMTSDGYSGNAVQLHANASVGFASITSPNVPVKPSTEYLVSYYIKVSGPDSARTRVGFHQSTDTGNADPEWLWPDAAYSVMGPCGWMKVTIPITTAADCTQLDIRFYTYGVNTVATIDELTLTELTAESRSKLNLSFESEDLNWLFVRSGDAGSNLSFDTAHYHAGSRSACFTKNSVATETKLTGLGRFAVTSGQELLFGGYFKSCGATTSKLQINLKLYDADGVQVGELPGRTVVLNNSDTVSDWTKLAVTAQVPAEAVYASFEVVVTAGQAQLWLDDLFYRVVNESTDETLVDFSDFSGIDEQDRLEGWTLETYSGSASLTAQGKAETAVGVLTVQAGSEAYMAYDARYFVPTKDYRITADYAFDTDGSVTVAFYDYQGNHIEGIDVTVPLAQSDDGTLQVQFTAPSATTAKLLIGGSAEGTYRVDDLEIYLCETVDPTQSWLGKWVWYQEDALTEAVKEHRYFLYTFTLADDATYAPLQISADDNFTLYINGAEVGGNMGEGQDQWSNPITYDILRYLQKGENVIAIDAFNVVSYAALIFDTRITLTDGSVVMLGSDGTMRCSKTAPEGWTELGFDSSGWAGVKEIGYPPCSPWGSIYFDTSLYADNQVTIEAFETPDEIVAGSTVDITATFYIDEPIDTDYPLEISIWRKNSTKEITAGILEVIDGNTTSTWQVGSNTVQLQLYIPDYLETGRYTLQLSDSYLYLANEEVIDNKFANIKVTQAEEEYALPESEVTTYNGKPTLFINGEAKAPLFYLEPAGEVWWSLSNEQKIQQSETELYVTNSIFLSDPMNRNDPIWLDADTIDYDTFDKYIYQTLSGNPDAMVMIAIGMNAPRWWLDTHPDDELLLEACDTATGTSTIEQPATRAVSFSSQTYMQEAGEVLRKLVEHVAQSSYASHIYGIKIQDGETCEYMIQGADDYNLADFSAVGLEGFRSYLRQCYGTDEALRQAWNDKTVTLDTATVPTAAERSAAAGTTVLSAGTDRRVIDYQYFVNTCSADYLLHYAGIIKEASDGKLIAGAYYGYMWNFNSPGANSAAHPSVQKILQSEAVDFVCSPFVYGERDWTESTAYDSLIDGIQASGKLYILELDTRSVYDSPFGNAEWDSEVGYCYTMAESIDSLKRDFAAVLAKGAGFWFFNMYGTWWYEDQFMQLLADIKDELYVSTYLPTESTADIAVFVDEMMYPYISGTDIYGAYELLFFLLANQRRSLAHIGASYDIYHMGDLVSGTAGDYKINIMLSPFEVTAEEQAAIEQQLKKDGKVIVWLYLPGISDGSVSSAENISALTGMETKLITEKTVFNAVFASEAAHALGKGLEGLKYGNESTALASPLAYITDPEATVLASLMYGDGSKTALAIKDMGSWTSVYSTVPNLPADFFANLLEYTGCHLYSSDSDIIYANSCYVSCYSPYGGEVTLDLGGSYSVYDVFAQQYYSLDTDTVTYTAQQGQTKTFRLLSPGKVAVLSRVQGGNGSISSPGVTELTPGADFSLTLTPQDGYAPSLITVDGVAAALTDTVTLTQVDGYHSIVCRFGTAEETEEPTAEPAEKPAADLTVLLICLAVLAGAAAGIAVAVKKKKTPATQKGE